MEQKPTTASMYATTNAKIEQAAAWIDFLLVKSAFVGVMSPLLLLFVINYHTDNLHDALSFVLPWPVL